MNNAVFGKTMENIRNRVDIKLCTNGRQFEKLVAKPNFKDRKVFSEDLVAVHMEKLETYFNKPIYIGMSILDTSKICLYGFYYDVLKNKYNDKIKLLYEDTDSLICSIKTEDFYEDMNEFIDELDTSDYTENNVYNLPRVNKKVLGKFKDEMNGKIIKEFVGLRSKLYAIKPDDDDKIIKKAKGIKKCVVKKEIMFDDFKNCLNNRIPLYKKQNLIRSNKHEIYTIEMNKKALSAYDDKRYIDGIHTLAWGQYKINVERDNFINHLKHAKEDYNKWENSL